MWYWSISIALGILRGLLFLGHYMATALLFPQFIWNWCLSFLIYCENALGFVFFMCWFSLHIDLPITWPSHLSNIFFYSSFIVTFFTTSLPGKFLKFDYLPFSQHIAAYISFLWCVDIENHRLYSLIFFLLPPLCSHYLLYLV